jgi:hypothetical protein
MLLRFGCVALALTLVLAGCQQEAAAPDTNAAQAPQLDAPAPASEPSRVFAPQSDAARSATGALTVAMTTRLPDAGDASGEITEVLMLTGANGLVVEATITGAVSPATQVQGQTLRALLDIAVEEPRTLVYRVTREAKPEATGQGLCGAETADYVVVWEPAGPGDAAMKVLGVMGGAPGAANARACPMLDYRRG